MKAHDSDDDEPNQDQPDRQVSMYEQAFAESRQLAAGPASAGLSHSTNHEESRSESTSAVGCHVIEALDENVDLPEYVKEHQATLSFPEKLMITLIHVERECAKHGKRITDESIGWVVDGKAFVIRNKERFTRTWVPIFFGKAKLSSFTRKLYRWGFRKLNLARDGSTQNEIYFGNENFQRDNTALLSRMRSITAAKTRNEVAIEVSQQSHAIADVAGNQSQPSLPLHFAGALEVLLNSVAAQNAPTASHPIQHDTRSRSFEPTSIFEQLNTLIEMSRHHQQSLQQHSAAYSLNSTIRQGLSIAPPALNNSMIQSVNSLNTEFDGSLTLNQVSHLLSRLQHFFDLTQPRGQLPVQMQSSQLNLQYLLSIQQEAQMPVVHQLPQRQNLLLPQINEDRLPNRAPSTDRDLINEIISLLQLYTQTLGRNHDSTQPPF